MLCVPAIFGFKLGLKMLHNRTSSPMKSSWGTFMSVLERNLNSKEELSWDCWNLCTDLPTVGITGTLTLPDICEKIWKWFWLSLILQVATWRAFRTSWNMCGRTNAAESSTFENEKQETERKFDSKPRSYGNFKLAVIEIKLFDNRPFRIHQKSLVGSFHQFQKIWHILSFVQNFRHSHG